MQVFHIRYRNTQGTLMRILGAVSRRGLDIPFVQAEPEQHAHAVTVLLDVNAKQVGQLYRDWRAGGRCGGRARGRADCGLGSCDVQYTASADVGGWR